jgi:purine-nucleoside phosphorylase
MGMRVLGISCVTNLAAGISATQLSHEEVFEAGSRVQHRLAGLFTKLVPAIAGSQNETVQEPRG